jgi:hypothetical protein
MTLITDPILRHYLNICLGVAAAAFGIGVRICCGRPNADAGSEPAHRS